MKKRTKKILSFATAVFLLLISIFGNQAGLFVANASNIEGYVPLDSSNPIEFGGTYIIYGGNTVILDQNNIYLDGSLSDEVAAKYQYVYNDIESALSQAALTDGTENARMNVYVAPYVYWVNDPEATDTVEKTEGYGSPYGMVVKCKWLNIVGLTNDPYNVVLASNRGQSHGANGNFTMFRFEGDGLNVSNLTMGNYCSIDLDYKLKPSLSHAKRTSTITQAQLADMSGDKLVAKNCNFISRLNLDPIGGAARSMYYQCHFESTDDALNGYAVYEDCDFDFYGNRPLYSSYKQGSVFLGCKFNSIVSNAQAEPFQYFTKEGGPITAVDCEYKSNYSIPFGISWTKYPLKSLRCYQYNIKHNDNSIIIGGENAAETVDMTDKTVLDAYRFEYNGNTYYNTYNLLRGEDDWDPMGVKPTVLLAQNADSKDYSSIPTFLEVKTTASEIESGVTNATISGAVKYYHGKTDDNAAIEYFLADSDKAYAKLDDNKDGTFTLTGTNTEDEIKEVMVYAKTASGLQGAVSVSVKPTILEAPEFTSKPQVTKIDGGKLKVDYSLDLAGRVDMSQITWYRCKDEAGTDAVEVAVTRLDEPEYTYTLTAGDVGYYIMASVEPKNIRSNPGTAEYAAYSQKIEASFVKTNNFSTDFKNFSIIKQDKIMPGFWTVDSFRPADTESFGKWQGDENAAPWVYGITGNGCVGSGIYQGTQGSRLMYTPVEGKYNDMSVKLVVDPAKTEGQGFGSAGQYMDIAIKFDTTTLTGYALRIVRTKAASNASTFVLVKYENGNTTFISDEIISSAFATGCEISIKTEGNKITAHVETPTEQLTAQKEAGWVHTVDLEATMDTNEFGGVAVIHTGTTGSGGWQNTTMLHNMDISWEGENNQNIASDDIVELPETDETPVIEETPATGDTSNVLLYSLLIMAAGCVTVILSSRRKSVER